MKFNICLIILLIPSLLISQPHTLPETPQSHLVQTYIEAFNSRDDTRMKDFISTYTSPEGLKDRPVEQRMERYRMMKSDIRSITLKDVLKVSDEEIVITAKNGAGNVITLSFELTSTTPVKLAGLRIELGEQVPAPAGPQLTNAAAIDSIKAALEFRTVADLFSGVVLVAKNSTILFEHAYGYADKRWKTKNTLDTKFNLGSINKFFTRLAIGQLAEKGKLSLDDTVIKYLPDYPNKAVAGKITIKQLLTMTSGMGDFFGEKFANTPKDKIRTLTDYLQFFVDDSLGFEPGSSTRYSNAGYILLGLIIEKVAGEDYYSYVREKIFLPAGMTNTDSYMMDDVTPDLATGYEKPENHGTAWVSNIYTAPGRGSSAGGGYSTVHDLLKFLQALRNGKLLSAKFSSWMLSGDIPRDNPRLPLTSGNIGIAGGAPGINAAIDFDASTGNTVIVLANYSPPAAVEVAKAVRGFVERIKNGK